MAKRKSLEVISETERELREQRTRGPVMFRTIRILVELDQTVLQWRLAFRILVRKRLRLVPR